MHSPVCRHVTPGHWNPGSGCALWAVLEEMGILWASNCTRPSVTSLTDVPTDPGLDTTALLRFWLPVFQAKGAPANPFFPTLSSVGNLGAEIPLSRSKDGGKPGPAHSRSDAASPCRAASYELKLPPPFSWCFQLLPKIRSWKTR